MSPPPRAQVKSALLLAALNADGTSRISQGTLTRDHSEKMLAAFGAKITVAARAEGGETISIEGPAKLTGCSVEVPRDPSSRRLPAGGGADRAGLGNRTARHPAQSPPHRPDRDPAGNGRAISTSNNRRTSGGEEIGDLIVRHSELKGVTVPAARAPSMIDEYPILAVAAAFARGNTVMLGLEELRVKESDRLAAIARGLDGQWRHIRDRRRRSDGRGHGRRCPAAARSPPIWITASP